MAKELNNSDKHLVFFDFDNTITTWDILDDMLTRFSGNYDWLELEEKWKKGEIGSRECLEGQIKGIRITKKDLDKYLDTIKIDPYFTKLRSFLDAKDKKIIILSDNFDYILNYVLKHNNIYDMETYCNKLEISEDRLIPSFPYNDEECCGRCAHCKRMSIKRLNNPGAVTIYIGDGLSDICASEHADIVYAKGSLQGHLNDKGIEHIPINGLKDVYEYFQRSLS